MNEDIALKIHDIKDIVKISDNSIFIYLALLILVFIMIISILILKIRKKIKEKYILIF